MKQKTECFIEIKNLSYKYPDTDEYILRNVDLDIELNSINGIVGKSGIGKTTLLKIIAGLLLPNEGNVFIKGMTIKEFRVQGKIGYMSQTESFFPFKTIRSNIEVPFKISSSNGKMSEDLFNDLMTGLKIKKTEGLYPRQLSGGMLQRAKLARAMITMPDLLLIDEGFSALDEQTKTSILFDFRQLWNEKQTTVIFVSHNLMDAVALSDKILIFNNLNNISKYNVALPKHRKEAILMTDAFFKQTANIRKFIHG